MYVNSYAKETYTLLITLNLNIWGLKTKSLTNIKVVNVALSDCSLHDHPVTKLGGRFYHLHYKSAFSPKNILFSQKTVKME